MPSVAEATRTVLGIRDDPVFFMREILGHDPWDIPEQIARAIAKPGARVAVKSCNASGKTFSASDLALWAVAAGGTCVTTAPTWQQVETVLWKQIRSSHGNAPYNLGGTLKQTEWAVSNDAWAQGWSTNEEARFMGLHAGPGRFLLIIEDESPGVLPVVHNAIEGNRAGGDVRWLKIGNPIEPSGPFYDCFTKNRMVWDTFSIDAFDTPNLKGVTLDELLAMSDAELDDNVRPYLVTRRWVYEKYHEWGEDSPIWQARVRGQFPGQSEDSLISLTWCEWAQTPSEDTGGKLVAGVDVAGPGKNETVVFVREGPAILDMMVSSRADSRGDVVAFLAKYRQRLSAVNVDKIGAGMYFVPALKDAGLPAVGINVALPPPLQKDKALYLNLRAQYYWQLREQMRDNLVTGLTDERTIAQLTAIQYEPDGRGRIVIESKDEMERRGVESPDRADALMLAFASGPTTPGSLRQRATYTPTASQKRR